MREITLKIDGMHCDACARRVAQALQRTPETEVIEVRVGAARVKADDPGPAIASIAKAGYTARAES